jgi:hypothetical protein
VNLKMRSSVGMKKRFGVRIEAMWSAFCALETCLK